MELNKAFRLSHKSLGPTLNLDTIKKLMLSEADTNINFIGQERAQHALEFGLDMDMTGYNLFVMGEPATGRHTLIDNHLQQVAKIKSTPHEWCYVNNFDDTRTPTYIRLAAGEGKQFIEHIESFIDVLLDTFPSAFDNPSFQRKKRVIERDFNVKYEKALELVESKALESGLVLYEEKGAVSFAPVIDGKPLTDAEFSQLKEDQRQQFYDRISDLEVFLNETLLELPLWKREASENQRKLSKETIENALKPLLKDLEHIYAADLGVIKFLKDMHDTLVDMVQEFLADEADEEKNKEDVDVRKVLEEELIPNILNVRKSQDGAPIVYEPNPSFQNIFGRIEYSSVQGSVYTSYRMIRAGALHKANGGYLLIDADKLMQQPAVWESLKLALKSQEIKMESPTGEANIVNASSLTPQPIPMDIKVILMGSRELYYLMQEYDNEFNELFRVLADFEHYIPLNDKVQFGFVQKIKQYAAEQHLEISADAVEELFKFSFRQAEHQHKLSARFADVLELLSESQFYAKRDGDKEIHQSHVIKSLEGKQYRTGQISESFLEDIQEGQILIDTSGFQVGKLNGLTVLEIGDTVFGTPARISATVYAGSDGVVDIEGEAELGKAIHSKGVMLLNGYLGSKYAQDFNLCFSANIAIEQSYGHIDGDSASLGEVCTLISAITHIPLNQSIAITGSINQHGQVQSIGGVNEKIEGYFKLCQARGLTGEQGVIIPKTNCINLVLSSDVISAVEAGQFHIYVVNEVDDALTILTGKKAGALSARGRYPRDSVNGIATKKLRRIADIVDGADSE
ncbi:ATP-dependent protease [Psychrosphaera saromensis]|uniref:endopeptidase La n=1 Tax=Psychrosphaera saromensis TaxID=716813 RepID=A0A2S7UXB6_9GAMM|nr:AAA family ATPase [Psychrosphaera saromensis]PQJ53911.1 ATP-dependent protease [Psychrosphaera saromensis]GHB61436.1 ATP-dependent protease [Psychrosphaera saromensis]GLQ15285.1 ATP-dependent protease [Psychrosphaera saromensis]